MANEPRTRTFETFADLRKTSGLNLASVTVLGKDSANDGDSGTFYWDATSTAPDDNQNVIQKTGLSVGRWIRLQGTGGTDTNFAIDNLTATGNRTHTFGVNSLAINGNNWSFGGNNTNFYFRGNGNYAALMSTNSLSADRTYQMQNKSGTIAHLDDIPTYTAGTGITITGTFPNYTISTNNNTQGTVTSVNAVASGALSVTGGPVTGSGSLTFNWTGDGTQYVAGDGTLKTFSGVNIIAGEGIDVSGIYPDITITNTLPDIEITLTGEGSTTVTGDYPNFTISSTGTMYTAGTGINIVGTVISALNNGTVTSVDVSASGALTSSGGPVTTSGEIELEWTGDDTQYVAGDGSLQTFPELPEVNDGELTVSGTGIATGSGTFTANQASDSLIEIDVPGTDLGSSVVGNEITITSSTGDSTTFIVESGGTVSSVDAEFTNGDSVAVSGGPITSIGSLEFEFQGTSDQYINGAGNLTTFPTIPAQVNLIAGSNISITGSYPNLTITSSGSSGGGGTVLEVYPGLGMDFTSFTISGNIDMGEPSSITLSSVNSVSGTTHTHAFEPGGTSSQYIAGDGTLVTFPTLPTVNDGTLTIAGAGIATGGGSFTANQSGNSTATITVPGTNLGSSVTGGDITITSSTGSSTTFTIPSYPTIYRGDDSLTSNRTVSGAGYSLTFNNVAGFSANSTSGMNLINTSGTTTISSSTSNGIRIRSSATSTFYQTIKTDNLTANRTVQHPDKSGTYAYLDDIPSLSAGTGVSITGTYPNLTITNTSPGITYSAGTGISLASNTITNTAPNATHTGDVTGSTALTIANNAVTNAKFRQSVGLSVVGRASNTSGNVDDIVASSDNTLLRRSGTTIGFGTIGNSYITDLDYSKLTNTPTIPDEVDLTAGTGISITGSYPNLTISATGGSGTVTSVALTVPSGLSVSGSPITTSGTLAITTTLNGVIKGNGSGFTAGNVNLTSEVTGTLPIANGGTGLTSTGANGNVLISNGSAWVSTSPPWETAFSKGNIIAGSNVSISGTLTNRLVGSGNITISATSGDNIYNTDGSLTDNRTLDGDGNSLTFDDLAGFNLTNNSGTVTVSADTSTGYRLRSSSTSTSYQTIKTDNLTANRTVQHPDKDGTYAYTSDLPNLIAGTNVSITGTYPNLTINSSGGTGGGTVTSVDMTVPTGLTVSGGPITVAGTFAVGLQSGYSIPTIANQTNWTTAYNDSIVSIAVTGTTTKTITLTQQDGGTLTANFTDLNNTYSGSTSVILNGTSFERAALTGDVTASQNSNALTIANNAVTFAKMQDIPTASLIGRYSSGTGDPQSITLGTGLSLNTSTGVLSATGGTGTVTSVSAGNLSPLFTTAVSNSTTTPSISYTLSNAGANTWFGNATGSSAAPSYNSAGALTKTDDTNVTLTLGGTPATALLKAVSLTLGWTGTLAVSRGGTGASSLTGVLVGNGTSAVTGVSTSTAGQVLRRNLANTGYEFYTPGTGGSVTSVNVSASGALSSSGGPVTTSGTISLGWTGSSGQYVRGDGSLATFPTIPGAGDYIQNQFSSAQIANGWISGTFKADTQIHGRTLRAGGGTNGTTRVLIEETAFNSGNTQINSDLQGFSYGSLLLQNLGGNILLSHGSGQVWALNLAGSGTRMVTVASDGLLGSQAIPGGGTGTVTSFSAGNLSPLFTTSVSNSTTTPALSFTLSNAGANTYFGNATGSSGSPSYTAMAALTKTDDTNVTLTLGGTPSTSLLKAVSLTLGWTGTLSVPRGGTGTNILTGVAIGNGSSAFTGVTGSPGQVLRRNLADTAYEFYTPSTGGSVTSVGLSITSGSSPALTVNPASTPVTTSGTLGMTWQGSTGQYVRGDGSLATFPTIPTSGDYIQNQNAITQTANYIISGTGIAGTLRAGVGNIGNIRLNGDPSQAGYIEVWQNNSNRLGYIGLDTVGMQYYADSGYHRFDAPNISQGTPVVHVRPTNTDIFPTLLVGNSSLTGNFSIVLNSAISSFENCIAAANGNFLPDALAGDAAIKITNTKSILYGDSTGGNSWLKINSTGTQVRDALTQVNGNTYSSGGANLLIRNQTTGRYEQLTIGTNLSISGSTLNATGGGGADTNFANTDLVLDANRTHDGDNFDANFVNFGSFSVAAASKIDLNSPSVFLTDEPPLVDEPYQELVRDASSGQIKIIDAAGIPSLTMSTDWSGTLASGSNDRYGTVVATCLNLLSGSSSGLMFRLDFSNPRNSISVPVLTLEENSVSVGTYRGVIVNDNQLDRFSVYCFKSNDIAPGTVFKVHYHVMGY